tara:strand:- start:1089 stop:1355 length:267 start_codon:yes stop_codon:yes gene_type:complete
MDYSNIHEKIYNSLSKTEQKEADIIIDDTNLNICCRCTKIVRWFDEMYWKGEYHAKDNGTNHTNYILGDYDSVCDECYSILSNQKINH